jgi:hypothetical protein
MRRLLIITPTYTNAQAAPEPPPAHVPAIRSPGNLGLAALGVRRPGVAVEIIPCPAAGHDR